MTDSLTVVHVYDGHEQVYDGRGSVPRVVWHLAHETAREGHDVRVVERQWAGLPASASHDGVTFDRIALRTGADEPWERVPYDQVTSPLGLARLVADRTNFARRARRRLQVIDPDVIHVHLPFAASVLATVAPGLRERTVYTAHLGELRLDVLTDDQRADGLVSAPSILSVASPDRYLATRVAHTTVLNDDVADAFVDCGVDPATVSVLPNGVDLERFGDVPTAERERVREAYGLGDGPVVLFVGTVMPRKGVLDLVRAIGQVDGPALDLVVAGEDDLDGEYVDRVQATARDVGVAGALTMPGFVPEADLPALYAIADLFVLPSLEEGFGMTAVEALAAGTPVVGTTVGALPDLLGAGEQGLLVDPNDPDALAAAIDRALADRTGPSVERAARERAAEYSWSTVAQQCIATYEEII
ncbi:glycosyltransferase family 4 protein [Halococcoides cellulosivorans]|uniref:glycosyltransferase family 4 protein n=1 Tax=Halococcoides cellulosivorans TaxID=1679096 RepID=UPI00131EDB4B|nr:glycosyltransferase family 4 protein [Halococcoides cellulosivorans]